VTCRQAFDGAEPPEKSWRVSLLRAEGDSLGANGDAARAQGFLDVAVTQHGDDPEFLQHLVSAYERLGAPLKADRTVEKLRTAAPTPDVYYLCLARQLGMRGDRAGVRRVLREGADQHADYRTILEKGLAAACVEEPLEEHSALLSALEGKATCHSLVWLEAALACPSSSATYRASRVSSTPDRWAPNQFGKTACSPSMARGIGSIVGPAG
jgi:hypothetical protein